MLTVTKQVYVDLVAADQVDLELLRMKMMRGSPLQVARTFAAELRQCTTVSSRVRSRQ